MAFSLNKMRSFFLGRPFMIAVALLGALFVCLNAEVYGAIVFALLIALILVFSDDIISTTLPFLVLCISVLQCYDSFGVFIKFAWVAIPVLAALVFHFVKYKKRIIIGKSFFGVLAVAVAVTLGGVGSISVSDYFGGASLYYIVGLGVGMAIAYILIRSQMELHREYDIREKFTDIMYIAGIFACFFMLEVYAENFILLNRNVGMSFGEFFSNRESIGGWTPGIDDLTRPLILQPGNNISTFIMMTMPFVFYRASKSNKNMYHLASAALMLLVLWLSGSRGGLLLGGAEFVICLLFYGFISKDKLSKAVGFASFGVILTAASVALSQFDIIGFIKGAEEGGDVRIKLILRSIEDFCSSPVFGKGLGYKGNADLYNGRTGTMQWYHMMIPQIIGSMGTLGILAYGYQIFGRVRLVLKKLSPYVLTLGLSYFGIFLMTQVNPGEFCPLPYELMVVMAFILIETEPDRVSNKTKKGE